MKLSELINPAVEWNRKTWYGGHFYSRRDPSGSVFTGSGRAHTGWDCAAPSGSPAVAPGEGEVTFAGWMNSGIGYAVIIRIDNVEVDIERVGDHVKVGDVITIYIRLGHLKRNTIIVKVGEKVEQGEQVAQVGSTGASAGPHIHWSITVNDPEYIHWSKEKHLDPVKCVTGTSKEYYYFTHAVAPEFDIFSVTVGRYTLRRGEKHEGAKDDIIELQHHLVRFGFLGSAKDIDGDFGPRTEAAVIAMQKDFGLTADGIVGERTWRALLA